MFRLNTVARAKERERKRERERERERERFKGLSTDVKRHSRPTEYSENASFNLLPTECFSKFGNFYISKIRITLE